MNQAIQPKFKNETMCLSDLSKLIGGLVFRAFIEGLKKLKKQFFGAPDDFVDSILALGTTGCSDAHSENITQPGPGPVRATRIELILEIF
jgi:hypothetical protein